jgi:hypothetical protein
MIWVVLFLLFVMFGTVNEFIFNGTLVAVFLNVGESLLKRRVNYWWTAITMYWKSPYNVDRDYSTIDWAWLKCSASGKWEIVGLKPKLSLNSDKSGVFVYYFNDNWECVRESRIPFEQWTDIPNERKGRLSKKLAREVLREVPVNIKINIHK